MYPRMKVHYCLILFFFLLSCKSHEVVQECRSVEVQKLRSVDTVVVHDSVYVSEKMRGDTVYLTRVEWRDRWRTRIERDTVVDVRVEKEIIEHPPERYVPKFYKWTAAIFWTGMALLLLYLILKTRFRFP